MAIQISGTTVINNSRQLQNIASVDATTAATIAANAGVGDVPADTYLMYPEAASNTMSQLLYISANSVATGSGRTLQTTQASARGPAYGTYSGDGVVTPATLQAGDIFVFSKFTFISHNTTGTLSVKFSLNGVTASNTLSATCSSTSNYFSVDLDPVVIFTVTQAMVNARSGSQDDFRLYHSSASPLGQYSHQYTYYQVWKDSAL
jgi:hypothetical protein